MNRTKLLTLLLMLFIFVGCQRSGNDILKAVENGSLSTVRKIIEEDPTKVNIGKKPYKYTPLQIAIKKKRIKIARYLISKNADVNAESLEEDAPLFVAISCNRIKIVKILLDSGAECNVFESSDRGLTPLHLAVELRRKRIVALLLDYGANVNVKNKLLDEDFRVHYPVGMTVNYKILKMLLLKGANPNTYVEVFRFSGRFAPLLHQAIVYDNIRLFKLLLKLNADVNLREKEENQTALHYAARFNRLRMAKLLIKSGADIHAKDSRNKNPLDLAIAENHKIMIKLLKKSIARWAR